MVMELSACMHSLFCCSNQSISFQPSDSGTGTGAFS